MACPSLVWTNLHDGPKVEAAHTVTTSNHLPCHISEKHPNGIHDMDFLHLIDSDQRKERNNIKGKVEVRPCIRDSDDMRRPFWQNVFILEEKLHCIDGRLVRLENESRSAWRSLELKLDALLRISNRNEACVGEEVQGEAAESPPQSGSALQDRKRLKERLKDAGAEQEDAKSTATGRGCTSMAERIFGIRAADARAGKERSRSEDTRDSERAAPRAAPSHR